MQEIKINVCGTISPELRDKIAGIIKRNNEKLVISTMYGFNCAGDIVPKYARPISDLTNEVCLIPDTEFERDLTNEMIDVGQGYDPYNHLGDAVVTDVLGV